jgi:long-subunit acyl-CoA synthetase (AMP-forming)
LKKKEEKESSGFDANIFTEFFSNVKRRAEQLARLGAEKVQQKRVIIRRKMQLFAVLDCIADK